MSDISVINEALKTLSREFGVERDRRYVLQLATLLIQLSKGDFDNPEGLVATARREFANGFDPENLRRRSDG